MTEITTKSTRRRRRAAEDQPIAPGEPVASPRCAVPESKTALVTRLLQEKYGASLDELVAATGWQRHTTRAALTGLRKKGHTISKDKAEGVTRYTILTAAQS